MSNEKMTSTQMPERVFGARTPEEQEKARVEIENRTSMLHAVGKPIRKKDAMQLLLGQAKYTNDLVPQDCLTVKLLRSPHANAFVEEIDTSAAMKVKGIEAIFTWKDVDQKALNELQARLENKKSLFLYLTEAQRYAVEEFVGQLPPYTKFNNFIYRLSQLGLTATENSQAK